MEREAYSRAVKHQEEVFQRVGHKAVLHKLLEKRWFECPDKTPMQSALEAFYEDAVRAISTENATF